jgi:hypothetical protein
VAIVKCEGLRGACPSRYYHVLQNTAKARALFSTAVTEKGDIYPINAKASLCCMVTRRHRPGSLFCVGSLTRVGIPLGEFIISSFCFRDDKYLYLAKADSDSIVLVVLGFNYVRFLGTLCMQGFGWKCVWRYL